MSLTARLQLLMPYPGRRWKHLKQKTRRHLDQWSVGWEGHSRRGERGGRRPLPAVALRGRGRQGLRGRLAPCPDGPPLHPSQGPCTHCEQPSMRDSSEPHQKHLESRRTPAAFGGPLTLPACFSTRPWMLWLPPTPAAAAAARRCVPQPLLPPAAVAATAAALDCGARGRSCCCCCCCCCRCPRGASRAAAGAACGRLRTACGTVTPSSRAVRRLASRAARPSAMAAMSASPASSPLRPSQSVSASACAGVGRECVGAHECMQLATP